MAWQMQQQMRPPQAQMRPPPAQQRPPMQGAGKASGKGGCVQSVQRLVSQAAAQGRPQPPPPPTPANSAAASGNIVVTGCNNATVSKIIKGSYSVSGSNHGKPVYKKDNTEPNVTVLIYYWDERDGPNFTGWWFGPKVGGDQVWSHAENRTAPMPPPGGWKVPWDGQVDPSLKLSTAPKPPPPAHTPAHTPPTPTLPAGKGHVVAARPQGGARPMSQAARQVAPPAASGARLALDPQKQVLEADRRRQAEEMKRKAAEMNAHVKQREEESKRRREEEDQKAKERTAVSSVRLCIRTVRGANPAGYEVARQKLEDAVAANLELLGSQAAKVGLEAEQALQHAQQRIDEINEHKVQEEKRKLNQEQRIKDDEEQATNFSEQVKRDAEMHQQKLQEVEAMVKKLEKNGEPSLLLQTAEAAEERICEVQKEASEAKQKIQAKQRCIGESEASKKLRRELMDASANLSRDLRSLESMLRQVKLRREKEAGKAVAVKKLDEKRSVFAQFDKDKDGQLSRNEVGAYAEAIGSELPQQALDAIAAKLAPVTFTQFRALHRRLFVAKWELLAREARAAEEAKRKVLEEKREAMKEVLAGVEEALVRGEKLGAEAEAKLRLRQASLEALEQGATEVESLIRNIQEVLSEAQIEEAQLNELQLEQRARQLRVRAQRLRIWVQHLEQQSSDLRAQAERKGQAQLDQLRSEAALALRRRMAEEKKSAAELFESLNGGGSVTKDQFLELLAGLDLDASKLARLYDSSAGAGGLEREAFLDLVKVYYVCVKQTLMNEELGIKSKSLRRLELREVLEALEGPESEDTAKVVRLRCRAVLDGLEGWVTFKGNQGTTFLEPGGRCYQALKDTEMTEELDAGSAVTRKVSSGEVIEVIEFEKKAGDARRIKGKAREDGACGWLTVSNLADTFLEPC